MSTLWVDDKTWKVNVQHGPTEGFFPSEESIAIEKYANLIKAQLDEFLAKKHTPMTQQLIKMVSEYNYNNNPEYKKQVDAATAAKEATKPKTAVKPVSRASRKHKKR